MIPWTEVDDAEGTGIVHIAPGCGQEDFALARAFDLPVIDPIDEFGVFVDGFDWQTGRVAGATDDPSTDIARDVAADLERKGLLVATEQYTHSYPHCWRCGTQLIFRLVDEWFIAMDPLREPVSRSTRDVTWLPPGIGLEERELDWLRNMGDWMISKKRYYGLALPIWECSDCEAWEVIGSKDELRERAVAGWDEFDGHTPHRPWIDAVEIACTSCGGRARRTTDVGNPWLDAGIVGLSTLGWNSDRDEWAKWYPADWISESFPGQFRNWFYALLTMSTVMTDRAPMRTLFAYALMRDEHGEEMHKSKGNAIWFDDAAEQIGADVMRWMFAATNPSTNLNFGPGPAHEVVRRFFLPLWNTYGFFVTYASLDGWTPDQTDRRGGVADHPRPMDPVAARRPDRRGSRRARRLRRDARRPGDRGLRRRAVQLVRASQPAALLEGRARRRQTSGLFDSPRSAHDADAADGADHAAPDRRDLGEPGRGGRPGTARQRAPDRRPGARRRPFAAGARGRGRPRAPDRGARSGGASRLRHPHAPAASRGAGQAAGKPPAEGSRRIRTSPRP